MCAQRSSKRSEKHDELSVWGSMPGACAHLGAEELRHREAAARLAALDLLLDGGVVRVRLGAAPRHLVRVRVRLRVRVVRVGPRGGISSDTSRSPESTTKTSWPGESSCRPSGSCGKCVSYRMHSASEQQREARRVCSEGRCSRPVRTTGVAKYSEWVPDGSRLLRRITPLRKSRSADLSSSARSPSSLRWSSSGTCSGYRARVR